MLSVCLAVAAAGASTYLANGVGAAVFPLRGSSNLQNGGRGVYRSLDILRNTVTGGSGGSGGSSERVDAELVSSVTVRHANRLLRLMARGLKAMAATQDAELAPYPAIHAAHSCAVALHKILKDDAAAQAPTNSGSDWNTAALKPPSRSPSASAIAEEGTSGPLLWPFVPPPPKHTALLLDSFQAALLCYSAFLHPDPDKDPLTLRAVERCHEQLLELCTSIGDDLRLGVAAVAYAAHAGLLPALEAVLRAAALTCRLETLRVLLTAVMSSVPALQQLVLSRDGYIFLTLRKLIIACVNLACPHPLEYPMPAVQPPHSRRSLTLILQQCAPISQSIAASTASSVNPAQHSGPPLNRAALVPDWVAYGNTVPSAHQAAADGSGTGAGPGRPSNDSAGSYPSGRPLILPLAVDLLDTVSMLARRFIEVHEGRVASAANIHMDAMGNVLDRTYSGGRVGGGSSSGSDDGYSGGNYPDGNVSDGRDGGAKEDGEGKGREGGRQRVSSGSISSSMATTRRRRSFEREATELLPLAQLLPFALWWLSAPLSDLVDALAQEVINDDGSGSLFGDPPGDGGSGNGNNTAAAAAGQRSHHPRASVHPGFQLSPHLHSDSRHGSIDLQQQPAAAAAAVAAPPPSYAKSDMRRRSSVDISRSSPLSLRPVSRGSIVSHLGGAGGSGGGGEAASADTAPLPPPSMRQTAWSFSPGATSAAILYGGERSWVVLSRCADTLHTLFRLMVTVSDLNRRAPHSDWSALIASLQPQQLLARAVQLLVHGVQLQRQQAISETNGRPSRFRGPAFPVLLSSLLSASVCGVQYGWLVPESFGIPSATIDPAELEQLPYPGGTAAVHPPQPPPQAAPQHSGGGHGPVQGPLFSRVRRFTVISANPEGRAYQWAMVGDEEMAAEAINVPSEDGDDSATGPAAAGSAAADGDGDEDAAAVVVGGRGGELDTCSSRLPRSVVLLQAAAPGGAWSSLPPPPGPAVVPTRALQVLVSEYGSAADKVLFELLLKCLSSKRSAGPTLAAVAATATAAEAEAATTAAASSDQFFWVPPSRSIMLRTCSNPCCMNLSGLHEAQLRLAACPRCGQEWYCSRHCQAMHWHTGHKAKCSVK
ncbi:hypothetical protein Vretimale_16444 [Volvox reticuliferus]|nr:hypothetical protein Vretimale_16444 [Volvox reticuliferus]